MPYPIQSAFVTVSLLIACTFGPPALCGAENTSSVSQQKPATGLQPHPPAHPISANWVNAEAKKLTKNDVSIESVRSSVRQQLGRAGAIPADTDIENMTLIVLQKASADAEADLKAMTAQMKATAERKAAQREAAKEKKDALADLTQQDQLKLQMLMDRRAKLEEMISQIMKKTADTAHGTVGNLK